jgi:hypothetical protein
MIGSNWCTRRVLGVLIRVPPHPRRVPRVPEVLPRSRAARGSEYPPCSRRCGGETFVRITALSHRRCHRSAEPTVLYAVVLRSSPVTAVRPHRHWRWSPVRCGRRRLLSDAERVRESGGGKSGWGTRSTHVGGSVRQLIRRTLRGSVSYEGVNRVGHSEYSRGRLRPPVHPSDAERVRGSGGG